LIGAIRDACSRRKAGPLKGERTASLLALLNHRKIANAEGARLVCRRLVEVNGGMPNTEKAVEALCDLKERTMLDHMILTVSNVERSLAFYEAALKPLDIKFFLPYKGEGDHPDLWGFGDGKRAFFWIKQGKPDPASIHWGFMAENNAKVDEFYGAAMSAGARNNISPRARVEYYPGYYAADVFDPDGYSFEAVHKSW
jgi:catechol 2,3-dioxygenase-like lactoylglutathione lyase family enzyme